MIKTYTAFHKVYEVLPILTIHRALDFLFFFYHEVSACFFFNFLFYFFTSAQIIHAQVLLWETERGKLKQGKPCIAPRPLSFTPEV